MELKQHLGIDLKLERNVAKDSILISVKKLDGSITTASISPNSDVIAPFPEYLTQKSLEENKKQKTNYFKLFSNIVFVIVVSFIGLFTVSKFLGYADLKVVLTGSMEPAIMPGDMVFVLNDQIIEPRISDVVIYDAKRLDGVKVASFAHRIIDGNKTDGFITKGDNNPLADVQKSTSEDITGVVIFVIPFIGKFLNLTNLAFLVILIVSLTIARELYKLFND